MAENLPDVPPPPEWLTTLVDRLHAAEAEMPDVGTLTSDNARVDHYTRKVRLQIVASRLLNLQPNKRSVRLEEARAARAGLIAAQAKIEELIIDAPDWRLIPGRRESNLAWQNWQGLLASREKVKTGCEYFGGRPALPEPLKTLVGGPENWHGGLNEIDDTIARLTPIEQERQSALEDAKKEAEALVSVTVS